LIYGYAVFLNYRTAHKMRNENAQTPVFQRTIHKKVQ